jgi:hypothetical protein
MASIYSRCPGFVERDVAGECLLVPLRRGPADANSIYVLNETGAGFWRRLDGKRSFGDIVGDLLQEYDVEPERLRKDLAVLVEDLLSIKAITA